MARLVFSRVDKAQFVAPPMSEPTMNFDEVFRSQIRRSAGGEAWRAFTQRPRNVLEVSAQVQEPAFWDAIRKYVQAAGPEPVLLVSRHAEAQVLRRRLYAPQAGDGLTIRHRSAPASPGLNYICTIDQVDVYADGFEAGTSWLLSSKLLLRVTLGRVGDAAHAELAYEPPQALEGKLVTRYRPSYEWADLPVVELRHKADRGSGAPPSPSDRDPAPAAL